MTNWLYIYNNDIILILTIQPFRPGDTIALTYEGKMTFFEVDFIEDLQVKVRRVVNEVHG